MGALTCSASYRDDYYYQPPRPPQTNYESYQRPAESTLSQVQQITQDLVEGGVKGDFIERPTFFNVIGQIAVDFSPANIVATFRDFGANALKSYESNFKEHKLATALTAVGFIPVVAEVGRLKEAYTVRKAMWETGEVSRLDIFIGKAAGHSSKYMSKTLPPLPASFASAFDGPVVAKTFEKGDIIYRSPSNLLTEPARSPGRWFGMVEVRNQKINDEFYNHVKWKNPNEISRKYEFTERTTVYFGKVDGGIGYQAYIPAHIDPKDVLRWKGTSRIPK